MITVLIIVCVILINVCLTKQAYFLETDFINNINKQATTWKAGVNFDPSTPKEHILERLGSRGVQIPNKVNFKTYKTEDDTHNSYVEIPIKFDARKKWIRCKTIGEVRDQGNCGSDWALSTGSAFADRLCVATNGDFNQLLSAAEITFCCHNCGDGCSGGHPIKAWKRFNKHGLVTGGIYKSDQGCQPYKVPPCPNDEQGIKSCSGQPKESNHKCMTTCYGEKDLDYEEDHRYTRDYYYLTYRGIQRDVMNYGPIEASFDVYDDFPSYKSGIYVKSENASYLGGHSVKLIGWGEEYGVLYWLMANSWNADWGDKGLFKIRRGTNECGVDNSTTGGVPAT